MDALDAALRERLELLEAVDVVGHELSVEGDARGVDLERLALFEGDEDGELGIGGIEELLLEIAELRRDRQDIGFDLLDLLVEALHGRRGIGGRRLCERRLRRQPDGDEADQPTGGRAA
jgi:hypothetical protein